ncbi:ABC transporter permease [Anaerosacchariphilus polymeriproducens]|uniref:MacB-like periplasmic core domain-containing protein n=1 Tax=Anaerosacchariphilus polymeriproducens TaxID=1812858 RepID=A0A371ARU0_9FIRM|nr:ABC transporter permease [Anaerosacchariphilus polymeriproducens]RDU22277.1 hypothetical protein DWV06_17315 [Anaerosacchariphilus polymeriproducens]
MTKRQIERIIIFSVLILAAMILWGRGITKQQYLEENFKTVSIRIQKDGVNSQTIKEALENKADSATNDIPDITIWNYIKEKKVENKTLLTEASVGLYEVNGNMELVYPYSIKQGFFPDLEDNKGCVISNMLAYKLFRSADVVGNTIVVDNKSYKIRGIVEDKNPVMLISSCKKEKIFYNMNLFYGNQKNAKKLAVDFLSTFISPTNYKLINQDILKYCLEIIKDFPIWLLAAYMLLIVLKNIWKRRAFVFQTIILIVVFFMLFFTFRWAFELSLSIPQDFIPTKWSDFSFWTSKFGEVKDSLQSMKYLEPVPRDVIFQSYCMRIIFDILLATTLMIIVIIYHRMYLKEGNYLWIIIDVALIQTLAIGILFFQGNIFNQIRGYYLVLPFYITFMHIQKIIFSEDKLL